MTNKEEKIRQRAHRMWEEEGRPEGRAEEHWQRAAREVEGQPGNGSTAVPGNGSAPHPEAKSVGSPESVQIPGISRSAPSHQVGEAAPANEPAPRRGKVAGGATAPRKRPTTKR